MLEEHPTLQRFTRFTKTRAGISLFSFVFALFFAGAVFSQEVIPQLQLQQYDSNVMNQVYGQSYFLNSLNGWTDQVSYYKGLLRASWEAAADNAIYNYVSSITTSDAYNDVNAYKDYVQKELDSQKLVAMNSWEDKANLDFLTNKNQFVARLTTNQFDQAYIERTGVQQQYQQVLNENARVNQLQNNIVNAANNWNANFNQSYQTGLNDFANTLGNIQDQYSDFLTNLNNSEATFQNNLSAIDSYKSVVKNAVKGVVGQFQGMLDETCSMDGCLYKYANGQFNDAGNTLNSLVGRLNTVLNSSTLDASDVLTTISAEIRTFLSVQSNSAYLTAIDYSKKVDTIQMGLNPSPYGTVDNSAYFTGIATGALSYSTAMHQSVWNGGLGPGSDLFVNVANADVRAVAEAIVFNGGDSALKSLLEGRLGNGRTVSIIASNIYTDWANGAHKNDPFAWIDVSGTQRDYRSDSNPWVWTAIRTGFTTDFQMGNIGIDLVYWMHDPVAQAHTSYWQGNYNSLGGQLNTYTNQISPAVRNWESQVASYNSFYEQWKVSADDLKAQAKIDYDNALADLEAKKSAWVQKMEEERQTSLIKWNELSNQAAAAESTADLQNINKQLSNTYNASISGLNISTNTNDLLNSYNGSLTDLGNRDFTFVEPTQIKDPIQDYQIVPKLELASLSIGALGNKIVSDQMVFGISNAIGISTLKQDPFVYSAMNNVSSALGGISSFLGGSSSTSTSQKFSIMNAASEKKVDTELTIDGKSLDEVFGKTTNGVYQYAQLLSMNENNSISATKEQEKLINQMAYQVTWDTRTAASLNDQGKLDLKVGSIGGFNNGELETLLTRLSKYNYDGPKFEGVCLTGALGYDDCVKKEKELTEAQTADYNKNFGTEIEKLKAAGYEIQGGKIVRSLSQEEKIRLGQVADTSTLTAEEKKLYGTCYVNPGSCKDLLAREFESSFNKETGVVTLSKLISNGQIDKKTDAGYISGTQNEIKYISLSQVKPVTAPVGKDLFDEWDTTDWKAVDAQASTIMNDFYTKDLARDGKALSESTAVIRDTESKNEKKFQEAKTAQEASDSFLKDMLIAYISGGMAGINASIKGKIEDQINSSLAAAFIRATGGSEDQISLASDLISYMRGKLQEKEVKHRANTISINDPLRSIENMYAKTSNFTNKITGGISGAVTGLVMTGATAFVSALASGASAIAGVLGNIGGGALAVLNPVGTAMAATMGAMATATDKYMDQQLDKMTEAKDTIAGIRANEQSLVKKYATTAVASSTGLPPEVASNIVADYMGAQAAKKVRRAINSNPLGNVVTQVVGVVGGIFKTAAVAFGATEKEMQKAISDGTRMVTAGSLDYGTAEMQSEAYMNQIFGMRQGSASYSSQTPTLKNKSAFVEELGQRIVVDELVKATGMDKDVVNAGFRKQYGAMKEKKADKKAQSAAIRSTAITAVVTVVTLGAGTAVTGPMAAVNNALSAVGQFFGAVGTTAVNVGAAVVKGAVQVIDGSRNGTEGMLAGLANGVLGYFGANGALNLGNMVPSLGTTAGSFLSNSALGLGVTYDRQSGWGGSIGIGSASANASISFSQRGNTTISASAAPIKGLEGLQTTFSTTTNGATSVGINYNSGNGPREGWNIGANYDINGGGFSGSIGYTDPTNGLGITSTVSGNGLSTSGQVNGVNLATNGPDGFNMDEMNWAEQNINQAQDRTNRLKEDATLTSMGFTQAQIDGMSSGSRSTLLGIANDIQTLLDNGYSDEAIAKMSLDDRASKAETYRINPEAMAISALASVGAFFTGALAFVGLGGASNSTPIPVPTPTAEVVARRREDGEDAEDVPIRVLDATQTDTGSAGGFNFAEQIGLLFGGVTTTDTTLPVMSNSELAKKAVLDAWYGNGPKGSGDAALEAVRLSGKLTDSEFNELKKQYEAEKNVSSSEYNKRRTEYQSQQSVTTIPALVPNIDRVNVPTFDEIAPLGGRDIEVGGVKGITEHNINTDRTALEDRVKEINDHNDESPKPHKTGSEVTPSKGVGKDTEVRYNVPEKGVDSNGNTLWTSYGYHTNEGNEVDNIHQFTNKPTLEMFVTGATKWRELQVSEGGTPQPVRVNDFSMPGAGNSPFAGGHHQYASAIDAGIPGSNGGQVTTYNSSNYDRNKTIQLIKVMGESVPPGYKLQVFFNDPKVISEFSGTNISVSDLSGHDTHIHFQLVKIKE
ncbi:TIGR04388 family protein [Leptospira sp. 'Mane']|uniref:TIGR04388 family protein n=1 Tax=Leptospira sp. 'Mane' TaxID=3387407 RepID=UPI00398B38D9